MEESRKGTAPTPNTKATSASLDEDFGNDFLTSWKSTKFGNDAMDFDVGTSEGKGKGNKFNFGKLDDFDLDADFDKLPAFKMDMSDLDFSSSMKKNDSKAATEKSLKDSLQGKDKEKKSFSFSFSFDDLGKFDLDPQVTSKEKKAAQLEPSTSVEFGLSKNQIRDLPTEIMDISKIDSTKASSKPSTSSSTSRPPLTEKQTSKLPSYDLPKGSDQSTRKLFSVSSLSNGPSGKCREAQATQSHSVKWNSDNKTDSSVQLASQAQIMTSVMPVTSSNNRDNLSEAFSTDGGVSKTNSTTLSVRNESKRNSVGEKEVGVENGTDSTATTSSTQRQLKLNTRQEKETSSLLCKPQPNSALTSEQPDDSNPRTKLLNSDSQAMGRPSNLDVDHAKSSLITVTEKASNIRASIFLGNKKPEHENRTVRALKNANGCVPIDNASPRIEKQILMANGLNSRLTKINQISPSATQENDLRSARFREVNRLPSQILTPILPNSASRGKPALISPPLKRKVAEGLVSDPFTPLKRISGPVAEARNSPTVALKPVYNSPLESRKPPEIPLRSETDMVSISETAASRDDLKPLIQTVLSIADFEIPVLALENNGNVEKAESISKELGDISSMLKKKQEEAKQLLVRAIVSNNKLLMLNHPMYAEKLSSLERFASTLRAKYI